MKNNASDQSLRFDPPGTLRDRAVAQLRRALDEQPKFVKIHAAEALLASGDGADVLPVFERELEQFGSQPIHRIGIWRVQARVAATHAAQSQFVDLLCAAYLDEHGPDSGAAAESLAKLDYTIAPAHRAKFEQAADKLPAIGLPFAYWLLSISGGEQDLVKLANLLDAEQPLGRGVAAYALRHLRDRLPPAMVAQIAAVAKREPEGVGRCYVISAAYVTAADLQQASHFKEPLLQYLQAGNKDQKYEAASALASRGTESDLPLLATLLNDPEPDVQVSAANAVLQIDRHAAAVKQWPRRIERSERVRL